jgi:hypothetical protein
MKTTTFVQPSHYKEAAEGLKSELSLLSAETVDVPDLFYVSYMQEKAKSDPKALENFADNVSKYIKGFWCDIMQEGLHRRLCEDKSKANIGKAASDLFDELLPKYVRENADLYPECYQVLKMIF